MELLAIIFVLGIGLLVVIGKLYDEKAKNKQIDELKEAIIEQHTEANSRDREVLKSADIAATVAFLNSLSNKTSTD